MSADFKSQLVAAARSNEPLYRVTAPVMDRNNVEPTAASRHLPCNAALNAGEAINDACTSPQTTPSHLPFGLPRLLTSAAVGTHPARIGLALASSVVAQLLNWFAHAVLTLPTAGFEGIHTFGMFVAVLVALCVVSPVFETLLMVPVLAGLRRIFPHLAGVVLASAALWATLHGLVRPGWAVPTFWLFVIFTGVFEEARRAFGVKQAILRAAEVHLFNNLFVLVGNLAYVALLGPKAW